MQDDLDEEKFPEGFDISGAIPQATAATQEAGPSSAGTSYFWMLSCSKTKPKQAQQSLCSMLW